MNINAFYILFAILIAIIAQATNTDLANNTTFLLLLLLALGAYGQNNNILLFHTVFRKKLCSVFSILHHTGNILLATILK